MTAAEGPVALLRAIIDVSAGNVAHPCTNNIHPHLAPTLQNTLYMAASIWGQEGRMSESFRKLNYLPLMKQCLKIMAEVAEGEQAGRKTDGPIGSCPNPRMYALAPVPPSVALTVLNLLHILLQDEHLIEQLAGELLECEIVASIVWFTYVRWKYGLQLHAKCKAQF